jgi:hypothetical protein
MYSHSPGIAIGVAGQRGHAYLNWGNAILHQPVPMLMEGFLVPPKRLTPITHLEH